MTDIDPYEVLGVPRNAGPDAIKKAKRRKAMQHHPDRGGDEAAFDLVIWAADLLGDPERRRRYDETGEAGERTPRGEPSAEDRVTMILASLFQQSLDSLCASGVDPTKVDLVQMMTAALEKQAQAADQGVAGLRGGVKVLGRVLGRFRRKRNSREGVAADLFERLARQKLEETERGLAAAEGQAEVLKAALDQLCRVEFEHEAAEW